MCSNSIKYLQDIDMDVSEPAGVVMVLALLVGGPVEVYSRTLKLLGGGHVASPLELYFTYTST